MVKFAALLALVLVLTFRSVESSGLPQQIHLSYGDSASKTIIVTWSTFDEVQESRVAFGICPSTGCNSTTPLTNSVQAEVKKFVDGGIAQRAQYIHRAHLNNLQPQQKYAYRCIGSGGSSEVLHFPTAGGSDWAPRIAVFGDLGLDNLAAVPAIISEVEAGQFDAVVGVGDYAYDFANDNATLGDNFMNALQPFASLVPVMLCPGNHEDAYNFSHFINRFSMPNYKQTDNMYYSFDLGPIHFVSISTEYYFYPSLYTNEHVKRQYDWIAQDLATANSDVNRKERPFIVVLQHRPFYCTEEDINSDSGYSDFCLGDTDIIRDGNNTIPYGLEELYHSHRVDIVIQGHIHYFERTHPVYKNVAYPSSDISVYKDPQATINVISGGAGNPYGLQNFSAPKDFKAFGYNERYTYGRLIGVNKTHLSFEHVAIVELGKNITESIDKFWIVKTINSANEHSVPYATLLVGMVWFGMVYLVW